MKRWPGLTAALGQDPRGVAAVLAVADTIPRHPERDTVSPSLRYELAAIVEHESGWRPTAVNGSGCAGLIQICPATARRLGVRPEDIPGMTRTEQAELVLRYYHTTPRPRVPGDLYLATFLPTFVGDPPGTVIACEGSHEKVKGTNLTQHAVWRDNPSLREGGRGCITVDSVRGVIHRGPPPVDLDTIPVPLPPGPGPAARGAPETLAPMALLILVLWLLSRRIR